MNHKMTSNIGRFLTIQSPRPAQVGKQVRWYGRKKDDAHYGEKVYRQRRMGNRGAGRHHSLCAKGRTDASLLRQECEMDIDQERIKQK